MPILHPPVPVQVLALDIHPANACPSAGVAVRVTVPLISFEQPVAAATPFVIWQLIPVGEETTFPVPFPAGRMVNL
jgi:hypothetical protein